MSITLRPTVRQLTPAPKAPGLVRTMFLVAVLVSAFGILASMLASSASAAPTEARQLVAQSNSFLNLNDGDDWPNPDDNATFSLVNKGYGIVTPLHRTELRGESHHCVDEVRGAYQVQSRLSTTKPGYITVTISAQMYEGESCATTDLDGWGQLPPFEIAPGATVAKTLSFQNTQEGNDDHVQLHLVLKNADA